jgi:hypothetical protein
MLAAVLALGRQAFLLRTMALSAHTGDLAAHDPRHLVLDEIRWALTGAPLPVS